MRQKQEQLATSKSCKQCSKLKNIDQFDTSFIKKDGSPYKIKICKDCRRLNKRLKYSNNKEIILKNNNEWRLKNLDKKKDCDKTYYLNNKEEILRKSKTPEKMLKKREIKRIWTRKNKEKINNYPSSSKERRNISQNKSKRKRRKNDPAYALRLSVSSTINKKLKLLNTSKKGNSCLPFLEYTMKELKNHLESLFEPWMNWNNRGIFDIKTWNDEDELTWTWQMDHIIPQYKLIYTSMEDENFKKCWALTNLRPLSAKTNYYDGMQRKR